MYKNSRKNKAIKQFDTLVTKSERLNLFLRKEIKNLKIRRIVKHIAKIISVSLSNRGLKKNFLSVSTAVYL